MRKVSLIRNLCTFETCAQYMHICVYSFEPEEIQEKNIYVEVKIQRSGEGKHLVYLNKSLEAANKIKADR